MDPAFDLHPKAAEAFDAVAEELCGRLRNESPVQPPVERPFVPDLLGEQNLAISKTFKVKDGKMREYGERALRQGNTTCILDTNTIAQVRAIGLDTLSEILRSESRGDDFGTALLDALLLYSNSNLTANPSDKLVYIFAALESMFLKDSSEPIQKNIGERVAFLIGKTTEERLDVVKTVTDVYGIRSRFVHHGHKAADLTKLARFMHYAWSAFQSLIRCTGVFQTKASLIDELEKRKIEVI